MLCFYPMAMLSRAGTQSEEEAAVIEDVHTTEESATDRPGASISENCLEIEARSSSQLDVLRSWIALVNEAVHPQPYLAEDRPGHFRLYLGPAAERARTIKGVR